MAITITEQTSFIAGDKKFVFANVAFGAGYLTGGEELLATAIPSLQQLNEVVIASQPSDGTEQVVWDRTNSKLQVFTADGTEQSNSSDPGIADLSVLLIGT